MRSHKTIAALGLFWMLGAGCSLIGLGGAIADSLEVCNDNDDNDGDGAVDCQDPECADDDVCKGPVEICDNDTDDDNDGAEDCEDSDCDANPVCIEADCRNQIDDDDNGLTDCEDSDCIKDVACEEEDCDDTLDNNENGFFDCDDPQCQNSVHCIIGAPCNSNSDCQNLGENVDSQQNFFCLRSGIFVNIGSLLIDIDDEIFSGDFSVGYCSSSCSLDEDCLLQDSGDNEQAECFLAQGDEGFCMQPCDSNEECRIEHFCDTSFANVGDPVGAGLCIPDES